MELLNSGTLSDFTVVVGDKEEQQQIPVHRERLAACSPVFAAMFRHENTKEAQERQVMIPDVRAEVFKDFLQFVYTGVRPKCGRLTTELLTLADKVLLDFFAFSILPFLTTALPPTKTVPGERAEGELRGVPVDEPRRVHCGVLLASGPPARRRRP